MFIKAGKHRINTDNVVDVRDETVGERLRLCLVTNAPHFDEIGRDGDTVVTSPYEIHLFGEAAEKFLIGLPVYEPVVEEVGA